MRRLPLHFAHGNGFPSDSYQELFDHLSSQFDVNYIPMVGHGEYPVSDNWPHLVNELQLHIRETQREPVIGLGHSMGGVLMFMTACCYPELFRELVLLDAPIPGKWRSQLIRGMKRFNLANIFLPIARTRLRRAKFHSLEEAYAYFREKPVFKAFTEKSLMNYVRSGLVKAENGYHLRFDRIIESKLFGTMPDDLYDYSLQKNIRFSLIYSKQSHLMSFFELRAMRKFYGFDLHPLDHGSHLFPFEYPNETAEMIRKVILDNPIKEN